MAGIDEDAPLWQSKGDTKPTLQGASSHEFCHEIEKNANPRLGDLVTGGAGLYQHGGRGQGDPLA